jgi:hypothetical protein
LCQLLFAEAHQNFERTKRNSLNPTGNLYNITHGIHNKAWLLYQLFTAQAHQNSERKRRSSLNPADNLYNIICAISGRTLLVLPAVICAGVQEVCVEKAQQPKSNRQPVQHHLGHQWPSYNLLCQLFSAQAHQNFEQTRRSSLNPTEKVYYILCTISGHLNTCSVSCFLRRRIRLRADKAQ